MPDFDIRLLPGPPRRGDRLCAAALRPDQVAQIITFGTLQARGVLRDVGRVLQMPLWQVDKLTKLVAAKSPAPVTLARRSQANRNCRRFRDEDAVVARRLRHPRNGWKG